MKIKLVGVCSILIILFNIIGYLGLTNPEYVSLFKKLVPLHLILMLVLMILTQESRNKQFWLFLAAIFVSAFIVELLGVQTGFIFGKYSYGETLGPKVADVPVVIGVNWILVIYSAGVFMKEFEIKNHITRAIIGALLITVLDILIEPVAIRFDFWTWSELSVPFQNYVAWFILSFIMLRLFFILKFKKINPAATIFFIIQFLFFFALNMKVLSKHFF